MSAIKLMDVSFSYESRPILGHVSLEIAAGERVALLGPNAAGKTTLLKLISGVLAPARGHVLIEERDVRNFPRRELARRIAVVPQQFAVPFAFTAEEIVQLGRTPHLHFLKGARAADRQGVEQAMHVTDTAQLARRSFNELSGGERQRVMIAMALAQEPSILLMDEPTQQLDITRQAEILDLVADLSGRRGLTVLATIHDLNLAARYFQRVVVLHRESLRADGTPDEVLETDFLREVYHGAVEVMRLNGAAPIVLPVPRFRSNGKG